MDVMEPRDGTYLPIPIPPTVGVRVRVRITTRFGLGRLAEH